MPRLVDEDGDGFDDRTGRPTSQRAPAGEGDGGGYQAPVGPPPSAQPSHPSVQIIDGLIAQAQSRIDNWDPSLELQGDLQDIIDGNGTAFDRTTAKVDDANARMRSVAASGRAGLLGILNGQNATAIQSQVGNQAARKAKADEQTGARALLAQVLASGQNLDANATREQLNQLSESAVPGDPLAVMAPIGAASMTAFNVWSQSQKDKKDPNAQNQQANGL